MTVEQLLESGRVPAQREVAIPVLWGVVNDSFVVWRRQHCGMRHTYANLKLLQCLTLMFGLAKVARTAVFTQKYGGSGEQGRNLRTENRRKKSGQPEKLPAIVNTYLVLFFAAVCFFAKLVGTGVTLPPAIALWAAFALPAACVTGVGTTRPA